MDICSVISLFQSYFAKFVVNKGTGVRNRDEIVTICQIRDPLSAQSHKSSKLY